MLFRVHVRNMENSSTPMHHISTLPSNRSEGQNDFMDLAISTFTYKIGKLRFFSMIAYLLRVSLDVLRSNSRGKKSGFFANEMTL